MNTARSDVYYLAQLIERLTQLEADLSKKTNPEAELPRRCRQLLKELQNLLMMGDQQAMEVLEYALLPKIHRFLGEVRSLTTGKNPITLKKLNLSQIGKQPTQPQARIALRPQPPLNEKRTSTLTPEQRELLIVDALTRLKMLLSEP